MKHFKKYTPINYMTLELNIVAKLDHAGCFIVIRKPAFLKQKGTLIFFCEIKRDKKVIEAVCSNLLQEIIESQ